MPIVKVIEVIASSEISFDDAKKIALPKFQKPYTILILFM